MKILNKISLIIGVTFASLLVSCEEFLTETNPSYITVDTFYLDEGACLQGLIALYNAWKDTNIYQMVDETLRSDLGAQGNMERTAANNVAYLQTFNNAYTTPSNKWAAMYECIFRANQLLEGIEEFEKGVTSETTLATITEYKAEAYFFRGLLHFWLHNSFNDGSVIIMDYVPVEPAEYYNELSPADSVKSFYRSDLLKALELGLVDKWTESSDLGRVTSYACKAVLGQSYLYDGDYTTAASYFKDIIDNGGYSLADVSQNMTTEGEFNSESILEVSYTNAYNASETGDSKLTNAWNMNFSNTGWGTVIPAFWLVEQYEDEQVDPLQDANWIAVEADEDMDLLYTQLDESYYYETEADGYKVVYTVVHQRDTTNVLDTTTNEVVYDYYDKIYSKVKYYDLTTGLVDDSKTTYTSENGGEIIDKTVRNNNGQMEILRPYSRRASYSLCINGDETLPYHKDMGYAQSWSGGYETGYFRKLTNWDIIDDEDSMSPASVSGVNLRLIRLSYIYLMYAECLIEGGANEGGYAEALQYVNRVRYRAGAVLVGSENAAGAEYVGKANYQDSEDRPYYDSYDLYGDKVITVNSASELMEHIMYVENPMELSVEGYDIRNIDLRRWGVKKERFESISNILYASAVQYSEKTAAAEYAGTLTQGYNWSNQFPNWRYPTNTTRSDYVYAAINYSDDKAYWPIPNTEIMANPYL